MSALLTTWPGIGLVVLRTAIVYAAILVGLRLAGKREMGQMTPFDLVVLLLLSNAVQNAMVGPDNSLVGGLAAAAVLLLLNAAITRLAVDPEMRRRFGIAGRERVLELFERKQQMDRLEGIYREVLHE